MHTAGVEIYDIVIIHISGGQTGDRDPPPSTAAWKSIIGVSLGPRRPGRRSVFPNRPSSSFRRLLLSRRARKQVWPSLQVIYYVVTRCSAVLVGNTIGPYKVKSIYTLCISTYRASVASPRVDKSGGNAFGQAREPKLQSNLFWQKIST